MKQALHIFLKDVRGLRIPIAVLMMAIVCFAVLDIGRGSRANNSSGSGMLVLEVIVTAAAWFLIARSVHEEALPDEDEFWLTRPYDRGSLLGAKILMAVAVVGIPLFLADCAILATQSLSVTENLWSLALRHMIVSIWLILPPLAIASVTRSMTQSVLGWLVVVAIAVLTYFPGAVFAENDFRAGNEKYALSAALVLIAVAVWRQYSRRATIAGRALLALAILLPAPPFPESAALAIGRLNDSRTQETSRISLIAETQSVTEPLGGGYHGATHCIPVPLLAEGVPPGWHVRVLSQNDTLESGGRTWSSGWHRPIGNTGEFTRDGYIRICATQAEIQDLGSGKPALARISVALGVFAPEKPVRVRATLLPFEVPGIGRCQFRNNLPHQYVMLCRSPVWLPPQGEVAVANEDAVFSPIARTEYPWTPFQMLPGLSPVYKWSTMQMDEGTPPDVRPALFGLKPLIRSDGELEFRTMKQVAVLRREISVGEVQFSAAR